MQQAVILFGGQRWGKEYVADMVTAAATLIWPQEWQRAQDFGQVAVVALDEYIAEEALAVAYKLGVPFYPAESHFITFHKHRLRTLWNQLAETQPHLMPVPFEWLPAGEASKASPAFPVIIKPDAYSGSVGVRLVADANHLHPELQHLRKVLQNEQARYIGEFGLCQDILIEQAIPRKALPNCESEFTLHMCSSHGQHRLLATSQKQLDPNTYIEVGHTVPAKDIPATFLEMAEAVTVQMLERLGVRQCISNWEFIATPDDRIALIEGQLRPSGDRLMQLIQLATGINPFSALLVCEHAPADAGTASIRWLGPKDILRAGEHFTIPHLPTGWQAIIDQAGLLANPAWPGPIDWYNRHVAIIGKG